MDFRYSHEGIDSTAFLVDWCNPGQEPQQACRGDDLSGENPGAIAYLFLLELKQCHARRLQSAMVAHSGYRTRDSRRQRQRLRANAISSKAVRRGATTEGIAINSLF